MLLLTTHFFVVNIDSTAVLPHLWLLSSQKLCDKVNPVTQAEAEEAERRARMQMEMKKSLTHILLDVTDGLFGKPVVLCLLLQAYS